MRKDPGRSGAGVSLDDGSAAAPVRPLGALRCQRRVVVSRPSFLLLLHFRNVPSFAIAFR